MANINVAASANALWRQWLPNFRPSAVPCRCLHFYRHARQLKQSRYNRLPEIETDSLAKTLKDHRVANRQRLQTESGGEPYSDGGSVAEQKYYLRDDPGIERAPSTGKVKRQKPVKPISMKMKVSYENSRRRASRRPGKEKRDRLRAAAEARKQQVFDASRLKGLDWKVDRQKGGRAECPWLYHLEGSGSSGISRLNEEINAFRIYMSEIPEEEAAVQRARQQVAEVLSQVDIPTPRLFGSRETGMTLRHSDLELLIPGDQGADSSLSRAVKALRASAHFSHTTHAPSPSRTPCVSAFHSSTGLAVTIHRANSNLLASSKYILNYISEFPTLPHLYTVLRMILETRSIFGIANDTVSSYGLTMMIVAALKLGQSTSDRNSHNDVGRQLLYVLKFYADADLRRYGISVDPPEVFCKPGETPIVQQSGDYCPTARTRAQMSIAKRSAAQPGGLLCLQDPANPTVDLGRWCFQTPKVQRLFGKLYRDLESAVETWEKGEGDQKGHAGDPIDRRKRPIKQSDDILGASLLQSALKANYDSLEKLRDKAVLGHGNG